MLKWIDLPPVWLGVFVSLTWVQSRNLPLNIFGGPWADLAGGVLVGGGLLLIGLAVVEMRRARTTVIPHLEPAALVQTGIFRRTRNPIYLGDSLILTGLIFRWDAWPSLALVPLFIWLITDRFILVEEMRLRDHFGPEFEGYEQRTPRWIPLTPAGKDGR